MNGREKIRPVRRFYKDLFVPVPELGGTLASVGKKVHPPVG